MPPFFPPRPLVINQFLSPPVHNICVLVRFSSLPFNFLVDLVFLCPLDLCSAGVFACVFAALLLQVLEFRVLLISPTSRCWESCMIFFIKKRL